MSDWILTKGLQNLRAQVNAAFPNRDKTSDGTIGDAAHMAETSGHNADDTPGSKAEYNDGDGIAEVRAWDMDSDLRSPGVTAQDVVDHIRSLPGVSSVLRYMIYDRKIYQASNGWGSAPYAGPSPHTEHIHYSGARTQAADNNTDFDYRLEDLVALNQTDADLVVNTLLAKRLPYPYEPDGATRTIADLLRYIPSRDTVSNAVESKLADDFAGVLAAAGADHTDEAAIAAAILAGLDLDTLATSIAQRVTLPTGVEVSPEQLQAALIGALRELAAAAPPAA